MSRLLLRRSAPRLTGCTPYDMALAVELCEWWCHQGDRPADLLRRFGEIGVRGISWQTAQYKLAHAFAHLQHRHPEISIFLPKPAADIQP